MDTVPRSILSFAATHYKFTYEGDMQNELVEEAVIICFILSKGDTKKHVIHVFFGRVTDIDLFRRKL